MDNKTNQVKIKRKVKSNKSFIGKAKIQPFLLN